MFGASRSPLPTNKKPFRTMRNGFVYFAILFNYSYLDYAVDCLNIGYNRCGNVGIAVDD